MEDLTKFAAEVEQGQYFGSRYLHTLNAQLSGLDAWDAVIEFALAARALTTAWAEELRAVPWKKSFSKVVSSKAQRIHSADEMRRVPVGSFIAFITVDEPDAYFSFIGKRLGRRHLVHAMISLGGGLAAGVGNQRGIGIGRDGRWEVLDLAALCTWRAGSVPGVALGIQKSRPLHVRVRPLADFQGAAGHAITRAAIDNLSLDLLKRVAIQPEDGLLGQGGPDWSIVEASGTVDLRLLQNPVEPGGSWRLTREGIGWSRPAYFLPYYPRHVVKIKIGARCPVFVNAMLTGCSIFASGDPAAPTLFHVGVIGPMSAAVLKPGTLDLVDGLHELFDGPRYRQARAAVIAAAKDNKPAFWKLLLERLEPNVSQVHWSEVNKEMYSKDSRRARAVADQVVAAHRADREIAWDKSTGTVGTPWGAYLGFLENGAWAMYLQENLTFRYHRQRTTEVYVASIPIALTQVYPPGREGTNLITPQPDRIVGPFTPSETVVRTA